MRKIYQKSCPAQGAVVSKVKGVVSTEDIPDSDFLVQDPGIYKRIWDISDIVVPSYGGDGQDGSFVVFTNLIVTPSQSRGVCQETNSPKCLSCSSDMDCVRGSRSSSSNGIFTGVCLNNSKTCEISGWCPEEMKIPPLYGSTHFNLLMSFRLIIFGLKEGQSSVTGRSGKLYHHVEELGGVSRLWKRSSLSEHLGEHNKGISWSLYLSEG